MKKLFNIDNSLIEFAKKERVDKQYYINFHIKKNDAEEMIKIAEKFNSELLDFISRLNKEDINMYRDKLIKLL